MKQPLATKLANSVKQAKAQQDETPPESAVKQKETPAAPQPSVVETPLPLIPSRRVWPD